ncbi:MAG: helix-turn-helix transcriptional regulator [Eubacteriales bacterium]|nr:helix-turn-helix transcriptional regulator [Eubacteriales bacterium]
MNLGNQIRANRIRRRLTQERLAESLGVTAQAVSKWESGASLPHISLLPELAAVLDVNIDELFEASEETQLKRIEAMLEHERALNNGDFSYIVNKLENICCDPRYRNRCLRLLAEAYMRRSRDFAKKAAEYASLVENEAEKETLA